MTTLRWCASIRRAQAVACREEHLAFEVDLDSADHQPEARQPRAHDLAQVGDARILHQLDEGAVVDVAVGIEVGEAQVLGRRKAVDAAIGKVESH
jgi:hypothetical protein